MEKQGRKPTFCSAVCGILRIDYQNNRGFQMMEGIILKKIFLGLSIFFMILTFGGAAYVLYTGGRVSAGFAVVPMVFALAFLGFEARETYGIRKAEGSGCGYQAHYIDESHNCNIVIQGSRDNEAFIFSFIVDDVSFTGSNLYDFKLEDPEDYEEASQKFHLLKIGGYAAESGEIMPYEYLLQGYHLSVLVPVMVVDKSTSMPYGGEIVMEYFLKEHNSSHGQNAYRCDSDVVFTDDIEYTKFCLIFHDKRYFAEAPTTNFEHSMLQVCAKCSNDYLLKCCFTCQYSDHLPVGREKFEGMLCYKDHQEGFEPDIQSAAYVCKAYEERL